MPDAVAIPNPLRRRDPDLVDRLAAFRSRLGDLLLDRLDALLGHPEFRRHESLLPVEDLQAAAHVLRILTQDAWSEEDVDVFDLHWRDAAHSALFADEF